MSSDTKWTPGPWIFDEVSGLVYCNKDAAGKDTGESLIADVEANPAMVEDENQRAANGTLIAASPKLYEALYQVLTVANLRDHPAIAEMARAALASARGEG